ncbi:hypothetical protein [Amycolatopsis taiwanensis]|uniref:hypothetical protein n=1 Tax=Amycolatopsis taiwanensis TaxID=342230 RepID=UPI00316AEC8F
MSRRQKQRHALHRMRGVLLTFSNAGLAITAHTLAGGGLPDTSLTLVLTGLLGWIGAALAEKTKGPLGVLTVLATAQLGMHLVLGGLMDHLTPSAGMILTHAAATSVTAFLLAHAESMLLAAAAGLLLILPVVWRPAPVPPGAAGVPVRSPGDTPLLSVLLRRVHGRRGPPARS